MYGNYSQSMYVYILVPVPGSIKVSSFLVPTGILTINVRVSFRKCHKGGGQNSPYKIFEGAATIIINIFQFPRGQEQGQMPPPAPPK